MGFFDSVASFFISDAYAEEPHEPNEDAKPSEGDRSALKNPSGDEGEGEEKEEGGEEGGEEKSEDKSEEGGEDEGKEGGEEGGEEGGDDEGGDDEEEEEEDEEEEEEPEDPLPKLHEECAKTAACVPHKHEYEECAARVKAQQEDENHKGPHEDCVEEFFEYTHCISQCAAPKLFKMLK